MPLIARVASQADMQLEFMRIGRSGEGLTAAEFRALAKRLVQEECNEELLPAFDKLNELLNAAEDHEALHPGGALPNSLADQLLDAYAEVADGIVDSVYVLMQMANTLSIPFDACFYEVHRSNMSKFVEDPTQPGTLVAIKDAGGKILKGPNFSKPNLKGLIAKALFAPVEQKPQMELAIRQPEHQDHTQLH